MKRIYALLAISFLTLFAFSQPKVGIISSQQIIAQSTRGQSIQQELDALKQAKSQELDKMRSELKALEKELGSPALDEQTQNKKSEEYQAKKMNMQRWYEDAQRELQGKSQKLFMEFEKDLGPILREYGSSNGFTIIYDFERAGIVYYDDAINVTEDIVKLLNSK